MNTTINLTADNFITFFRSISILKDICNDIDIKNGMIRQKTNDKFCIFEMDMTKILGENATFTLSNLKYKIDLLKNFIKQQVTINVDEKNFSFSDDYTLLRFSNVDPAYIDNSFRSEREVPTLLEEDILLSCEISKIVSERIKSVTQNFNVNQLDVVFDEENAVIYAKTSAKDQYAEFVKDIILEKKIKGRSDMNCIPFIIDHDNSILLNIYNGENQFSRFNTSIGDVDITIYSRVFLEENE